MLFLSATLRSVLRRLALANMECFLMCSDKSHARIYLPDQKAVVVGRTPATEIQDKRLSRKQVELTADYGKQTVFVKQLGLNPSTVGVTSLAQNETHTLGPGGKLYLLGSKYEHFVYFTKQDGCMQSVEDKTSNQKRKYESEAGPSGIHSFKRQKTDDNEGKATRMDGKLNESKEELNDPRAEFGEDIIEEINNSQDGLHELQGTPDTSEGTVHSNEPLKSSQWEEIARGTLLIHRTAGLVAKEKVASFDLDGTIITTKSGRVFATGPEDWKIKYPQIPAKLQEFHKDGFKIVIFTNQGPISKGKLRKEDFRNKMEKISLKLQVPLQVFAATDKNIYRKPLTGMWRHLVDKENCGLPVDYAKSLYVGDAAGRPANWAPKMKKDFACSDRTFAKNVGISFQTAEEFFLNQKPAPFNWPEFNPKGLKGNDTRDIELARDLAIAEDASLFTPPTSRLISDEQEVVVMVGYPASGKTTFVKKHLLPQGYVHVNRDTVGSWQKCVAKCSSELARKKSVVIDNTSPDKESRQRYIKVAKNKNIPVRCFVFNVSYDHALHNNRIRELMNEDKNYKAVGRMVFNTYRSSFQEPATSEGFKEILHINFVPHFETSSMKDMYMQYTE